MNIINQVKMRILNKSVNESFARIAVSGFVSQKDVTIEVLSDIKTAVSEAITNAIVHGYRDEVGEITLECRLYDNNTLEISVADDGHGIEDVHKAREPLFTTQPEMERSGMGFTVMETFMDTVEVESGINKGTRVIMRKKL